MSNANYKSLFKATGLFGIVEVIRMLLRVFVNKSASYFLGPAGVGILGLVENIAQLIISLTGFGVQFTGVREIAANKLSDEKTLNKTIKFVNIFVIATGILAAIFSIIFSNYLSIKTFDSDKYKLWFVFLAIYFIGTSYVQSRTILLEGLQNIKKLIILNIISNFTNSIIFIGCYYYYKIDGIILAMIITAVVNFFIFWRGTIQYTTKSVQLSKEEIKSKIKYFSKSGGLLAINSFVGLLCYYLIRTYLKPLDSGNILGYYQIGNVLMVSYVGIIFIAISKFYFPKLTEVLKHKNNYLTNELVNNQLELCLLILMPAIFFMYLVGNFCIEILFSSEFIPVYEILVFGLFSVFLRGFNYVVGYMILSNNDIKQYFYINILSDVLNVVLTVFLYDKIGLYGIGLSIAINYFLSAIYIYYFVRKSYDFNIQLKIKKLMITIALISSIITISYFEFESYWYYFLLSIFFVVSLFYSLIKLDKYLFNHLLLNKLKTFFKINK